MTSLPPRLARISWVFLAVMAFARMAQAQVPFEMLHGFDGGLDPAPPPASTLQARNGTLYVTTAGGGDYRQGSILTIAPDGTVTRLHSFSGGVDGAAPSGGLIEATDGNFYGTTSRGGATGFGTVFRVTSVGVVTVIYAFAGGDDGAYPKAALVQGSDGSFYGTTSRGGRASLGTVFRIASNGVHTVLHSFFGGVTDGAYPEAALIQARDGNFYGTTAQGGYWTGTVFVMTPAGDVALVSTFGEGEKPYGRLVEANDGSFFGTTLTYGFRGTIFRLAAVPGFPGLGQSTVHDFGWSDLSGPIALLQTADGDFYGTTAGDGFSSGGTIFKLDATGLVTTLYSFGATSTDGAPPAISLAQTSDGSLVATTSTDANSDTGAVFLRAPSGIVSTLCTFSSGSADAAFPAAPLVEAQDGSFIGTTTGGGLFNRGAIFRMTQAGALAVLHAFEGGVNDGAYPQAALLRATDGNFYGTTISGGQFGAGTVFQVSPSGNFALVHHFSEAEGAHPTGALIQAADGMLYGTASDGGAFGRGTVFQLTLTGALTVQHHFAGGSLDGATPGAALLQATDGNFYGTTSFGGTQGYGTVFRMSANGTVTVLQSLLAADGSIPLFVDSSLLEGPGPSFYGMVRSNGPGGSVAFRITASGAFIPLHVFDRQTEGYPTGSLIWGMDGNLYGATTRNVFRMALDGTLTVLHSFTDVAGGQHPVGLVRAGNGDLYATTLDGGAFLWGGTLSRLRLAPVTPSSVSARTTGGHVELAWSTGPVAASYTIKRTDARGETIVLATGVTGGSYVDTTAGDHRTYRYSVTAVNSYGTSLESYQVSITPGRATPNDFDGDGKTDVAVFRASTGTWYIRQSSSSTTASIVWGGGSDIPVPADYDGDGIVDVAIYRPSIGTWYIRQSSTLTTRTITWGGSQDIPVPGDYDGDGIADVAIFRAATGTWYVRLSSTLTVSTIAWGMITDVPVPGDYDGDGKTDIAVFRRSTGEWFIRQTTTLSLATVAWGADSDIPVPADYDGDGRIDVAVFRPSTGEWLIRSSSTLTSAMILWGGGDDLPVPGDYDGDGRRDAAVFRRTTGDWFIRQSSTLAAVTVTWGDRFDVVILPQP